jgi:LAO/AO transport system kinase
MEIADVFVVNKADREGVDRVVAEIQSMLGMAGHVAHVPEIVKTVATADEGTAELVQAVEDFRQKAAATGLLERKRRAHLRQQLEDAVRARVMSQVFARVLTPAAGEATLDRLARREVDPFTAAEEVARRLGL